MPAAIAVTMGDPAGIGPEIVLRSLLGDEQTLPQATFVVYGDAAWLRHQSRELGLDPGKLKIEDCCSVPPGLKMGRIDPIAGRAAFDAVKCAAMAAMSNRVRAVITAPLNKEALNLAGHAYPGHTEILAEIAGDVPVRMMLANDELRTVLASIHQPLRRAIDELSSAGIIQTIRLTHQFLLRAGVDRPRIAVAGLNPHAGENGLIGREEIELIAPAIEMVRQEGIDASGPHSPDTVFMRARRFVDFDVVIAMYHDQGLIPIKYLGLDNGVNVTIGLPFVRTSPDHGTAFGLAGQGRADIRSMQAAIGLADSLSRSRLPAAQ